jgi:cytochrome c2
MRRVAFILVPLLAALAGACDDPKAPQADPAASHTSATTATPPSTASGHAEATAASDADPPLGDAESGKALAQKLECNRCHDGTDVGAATLPKHCVHCHQQIIAGTFKGAPAAKLAAWQEKMVTLREVPSLSSMGKRYRRAWIERFLQEPHDLRPRLLASMPRLKISGAEARDLATWLTSLDGGPSAAPPVSLEGADLARGRKLIEDKGCGSCHAFSGVPALAGGTAPKLGEKELRTAVALAPDLRFARDRYRAAELWRWMADPKAVKPDTTMPLTPSTPDELKHMTAYILQAPLAAAETKPMPARLPVLDRKVTYDEVYKRVLRDSCRHCHAEPDYDPAGDGGPGNTGGFGFPARKLDLARWEGVQAGWITDKGERESVFKPMSDGTPRLLAAMIARQAEEAGKPNPEIRGMPLGLPAFSAEDVQLVETWIAQGRPQ